MSIASFYNIEKGLIVIYIETLWNSLASEQQVIISFTFNSILFLRYS